MKSGINKKTPLQTFFVSHEIQTTPYIRNLLTWSLEIAADLPYKKPQGIISVAFGKRTITFPNIIELKTAKNDDIVEVIDYDAIKNLFLIIGKKYPTSTNAVHWMIHNARKDIGIILYLKQSTVSKKNQHISNITNLHSSSSIIEQAKTLLKALQHNKHIFIENQGIIFTSKTYPELKNEILHYRGIFNEN